MSHIQAVGQLSATEIGVELECTTGHPSIHCLVGAFADTSVTRFSYGSVHTCQFPGFGRAGYISSPGSTVRQGTPWDDEEKAAHTALSSLPWSRISEHSTCLGFAYRSGSVDKRPFTHGDCLTGSLFKVGGTRRPEIPRSSGMFTDRQGSPDVSVRRGESRTPSIPPWVQSAGRHRFCRSGAGLWRRLLSRCEILPERLDIAVPLSSEKTIPDCCCSQVMG